MMRYLPILQELFESDAILFLLIALVLSGILGLRLKSQRSRIVAISASFVVYLICELSSNVHTSYLIEFILLFLGTAAIGCIIGFLCSLLFGFIKSANGKA